MAAPVLCSSNQIRDILSGSCRDDHRKISLNNVNVVSDKKDGWYVEMIDQQFYVDTLLVKSLFCIFRKYYWNKFGDRTGRNEQFMNWLVTVGQMAGDEPFAIRTKTSIMMLTGYDADTYSLSYLVDREIADHVSAPHGMRLPKRDQVANHASTDMYIKYRHQHRLANKSIIHVVIDEISDVLKERFDEIVNPMTKRAIDQVSHCDQESQ